MDCRDARESLSEYIDGMLADAESARMTEHLAHCAACRERYETMSRIRSHMQLMEPVDEPAHFAEKVHERLDRRFSPARMLRQLFLPLQIKLPAAAVILLALFLVYSLGVRDRGPDYEIAVSLVPALDAGAGKGRGPKKGEKREEQEHPVNTAPLEALVASIGGRIVQSGLVEGADSPRSITVELRAGDLERFLAGLSLFAVFEEPSRAVAKEGEDLIRVKILFSRDTSPVTE